MSSNAQSFRKIKFILLVGYIFVCVTVNFRFGFLFEIDFPGFWKKKIGLLDLFS